MKRSNAWILLISLILMSASDIRADDTPSAAQVAETLRAQLLDVQVEESELQGRAQQLDWDLRPENIERYFAGTGSTRPEELREQRRRQLQNEKDRVLARLEQLGASRARLESDISIADAEAYRQSIAWTPTVMVNQMLGARYLTNTRLLAGVMIVLAMVGALALVAVIRRRRRDGRLRFTSP
ncbi:MAG: hypothetical protein WCF57_15110 [Pyrinomonadaceae bacterium]